MSKLFGIRNRVLIKISSFVMIYMGGERANATRRSTILGVTLPKAVSTEVDTEVGISCVLGGVGERLS
jgi:hypothetical protein